MTSPTCNGSPPVGVEAGYSEDYGAEINPKLYPTLGNTSYSEIGVYGSFTNWSSEQPG